MRLMYSERMKPIVSSAAVASLDKRVQEEGFLPGLCLMESAGLQIYQSWKPLLCIQDRLVFLVGGGNNGGDALVVSRYAYNDGFRNQLLLCFGSRISDSCQVHRKVAQTYGIEMKDASVLSAEDIARSLSEASWIVDGLMGTGLRGPLQGKIAETVELANASMAKNLAIDIPSGLGDTVPVDSVSVHADLTVTMGHYKKAMFHPSTRRLCGKILCVNPSFPPVMLEETGESVWLCDRKAQIPALEANEYKNTRSHVAVFGGSKSFTGAVRLACKASFAARAGLVSLYTDPELFTLTAQDSPSVMVKTTEALSLQPYQVLLAGPGWGSGRQSLLQTLLASGKPMVLDADGIRAYADLLGSRLRPGHGSLVLTPHIGELRTLVAPLFGSGTFDESPDGFFTMIARTSAELDAVLVVKSSLVHIVHPDGRIIVIEGNNPSLGVAGSGDVLSGIIAALLAKSQDPWFAALEGSLVHQRAGVLANEAYGYYDSETLLAQVGKAVQEAEG